MPAPSGQIVVMEGAGLIRRAMVALVHSLVPFAQIDAVGSYEKMRASILDRRPDIIVLSYLSPSLQKGSIADIAGLAPDTRLVILDYGLSDTFRKACLDARAVMLPPDSDPMQARAIIFGIDIIRCAPCEAFPPLTGRQSDVLMLIAAGLSNKEIALKLDLLEGTVKSHIRNLMSRLNLHNRVQLAVVACERSRGWGRNPR